MRDLLGWAVPLDAINPTILALGSPTKPEFSSDAAVCLDASAYLHLHAGRNPADLIDYFAERHAGPLIVSIQTLQELWNNHVGALPAVADKLARDLDNVAKTIEKIEPGYQGLKEGAADLVENFKSEFGHVLDPTARRELVNLLERLKDKAIRSQVSHAAFADLAALRKRAKTPPGFRDAGDGDFYVWAELLTGLLLAKSEARHYDCVLLVTDDVKKDWSTDGQPHPILVAEVDALVGVPFRTLTLNELKTEVARLV